MNTNAAQTEQVARIAAQEEVHMTTIQPGARVLADIVLDSRGTTSREQVLVERVLDADTILVRIESSIATPVAILGMRLPISTSRVVATVSAIR